MRAVLFSLLALLILALGGCESAEEKKEKLAAKVREAASMKDQSQDHEFQAFLTRLRLAIAARDLETMASMMAPDFLWRLQPEGSGDGVFAYWDKNNLWPELNAVMRQKFWPDGRVMISPREFLTTKTSNKPYTGYRAGITVVNGGWKFVFFVNEPGAAAGASAPSASAPPAPAPL